MIEATATAGFLGKSEKLPYIRVSIRKLDTIKVLLMVLWETRSLEDKQYITLSEKFEAIGKMLGGWHGQILQQTTPGKNPGEK